MAIPIQGIDSLLQGVKLANEAYDLDNIPNDFNKYRETIKDARTGLGVKFLQKDLTVYVLVAGTDNIGEDIYNWFTKGTFQFNVLDPTLRQVVIDAKAQGYNVVVAGDSGGGLVAQHAHVKYGVDAFMTNTTGSWNADVRIDQRFRDPALYNPNGKAITVVNDGEILSSTLGYPAYGQVYIVPTAVGARVRYLKDELGNGDSTTAVKTFEDGVHAHQARRDMINYLAGGGQVFKPDEINYSLYTRKFPQFLLPGSYSLTPYMTRYRDSNEELEYLQGEFGSNMNRQGLATMLGVPVDRVIRGDGGYFRASLDGIPEANIAAAEEWFKLKKESSNRGHVLGWDNALKSGSDSGDLLKLSQQLQDLFTPVPVNSREPFAFKNDFNDYMNISKIIVDIDGRIYEGEVS